MKCRRGISHENFLLLKNILNLLDCVCVCGDSEKVRVYLLFLHSIHFYHLHYSLTCMVWLLLQMSTTNCFSLAFQPKLSSFPKLFPLGYFYKLSLKVFYLEEMHFVSAPAWLIFQFGLKSLLHFDWCTCLVVHRGDDEDDKSKVIFLV